MTKQNKPDTTLVGEDRENFCNMAASRDNDLSVRELNKKKKINKIKNQAIRDWKFRSIKPTNIRLPKVQNISPQSGEEREAFMVQLNPMETRSFNFMFKLYNTLLDEIVASDFQLSTDEKEQWETYDDLRSMFTEDPSPFDNDLHKMSCIKILLEEVVRWHGEIVKRSSHSDSLLVSVNEVETRVPSSSSDRNIQPQMFKMPDMLKIGHMFDTQLGLNISADDAVVTVVDGLSSAIKNANLKVDSKTERMLDRFADKVSNTKHEVKFSMDLGLSGIIEMIKDNLPTTVIVAAVCLVAYNYMPRDLLTRTLFCGAIVAIFALYLNSSVIYNEIIKFFSGSDVKAEMYDTDDYGSLMASCLNIGLSLGSARHNLFTNKGCCDMLHTVGKIQNGSKGLVESLSQILRFIWEHVDRFFKGGSDAFVLTGHAYVDEFLEETAEIKKLDEGGEIFNDQGNLDRVNAAIRLGMTVILKIPTNKDWMKLRFVVDRCTHELESIRKKLLATNFKFSGMRAEPVSILMQGGPGVGKSNSMQHLAHALAARTFTLQQLTAYRKQSSIFIFNRQAEVKHWDGYDFNKRFVFFDDLLQQKDIAGDPDNEIMNIVRAINCFEYQLHCAAMELKGNTMLRADFIIGNTNQEAFNFASINCARAFMRRWDIVVVVTPKEEFAKDDPYGWHIDKWKREIDFDKVKNQENASKMHPSNLEFHVQKMHPKENKFVDAGIVWTWKQMVEYAYGLHLTKKQRHEEMMIDLERTLVDFTIDAKPEGDVDHSIDEIEYKKSHKPLQLKGVEPISPELSPDIIDKLGDCDSVDDSLDSDILNNAAAYSRELRDKNLSWMKGTWTNMMSVYHDLNMDLDSEVKGGPWGNLVEYCDTLPFSRSMRVKENCKKMWFELYYRYKIRITVDKFAQIFMKYNCHEGFATVDELSPDIYDLLFHDLIFKEEKNEVSVFSAYLTTNRVEYKAKIDTSNMEPWKANLFYTYNWIIGWFAESVRQGIEVIDPACTVLGKTKAAMVLSGRIGLAAMIIHFVSRWIVATFASIKKDFPEKKIGKEDPRLIMERDFPRFENPDISNADTRNSGESDPRPEKATHHRVARHKSQALKAKLGVKPSIKAESLYDSSTNLMDIAESVAKKNLFEWWAPIPKYNRKTDKTHSRSGMCLAIVGTIIFVPYHFVTRLAIDFEKGDHDDEAFVTLRSVYTENRQTQIRLADLLREWDDESPLGHQYDIAVFNVPHLQPCRDISHLFATESQINLYDIIDCVVCLPPKNGSKLCQTISMHAKYSEKKVEIVNPDFEEYTLERVWYYYNRHTGPGDCGAPLYVNDRTKGSLIIGMHMAGGDVNGFSVLLTNEIVKHILSEFAAWYASGIKELDHLAYSYEDQLNLEIAPNQNIKGNMEVIGELSKSLSSNSNGRTKIVKSPLWDTYDKPRTRPARLYKFYKDEVLVDPMAIALTKYCPPDPCIPERYIKLAEQQIYSKLLSNSRKSVRKRIYTFDEAILGTGEKFSKLPRVTSAGFPYNTMKGKTTKERFFGSEDDYDLTLPACVKLHESVDLLIGKAKRGIRSTHVYTDFLKDERRPIEKWENGQTRLVSGSPVELTIMFRMYFGAFIEWMYENSILNGCALDTNHNSRDWSVIVENLQRFGIGYKNMGAGDYKNFDGSHNVRVQQAILDLIERWYAEEQTDQYYEDRMVRRILWFELTNSLHLNGSTLMYWFGSLPSGTQLTPVVGDLMNHFNFHIIWMMIHGPYSNLSKFVWLITRSDDHVYSVHPDHMRYFTESRVANAMKRIGYNYTSEDKTSELKDALRGIEEVTFLKRRFVWDKQFHRYIAPLDKNVIVEIPMWIKVGASLYTDVSNNVNVAIEEASLHEPEWYVSFVGRLVNACKVHPDIELPVDWVQASVKELVLNRKPPSRDYDTIELITEGICSEEWLPTSFTEIHDGKEDVRLSSERSWGIYPYCQDGTVAALPISRSHGFENRLARLSHWNCATENKSQATTEITDGANIGEKTGGVFNDLRTAMNSEAFPPGSTTHAVNDADTVKAASTSLVPPPLEILDQVKSGVTQEIRDFLAKPQIITSGVFTTGDAFPAFIWQGNIPSSIINSNPIWQRKIEGNYAIRATTVLTIQFNGNRFQQGRYMLCWVPGGGCYTTNRGLWETMHSSNLMQATQLPHVEFDINCDTQAILEIPLINVIGYAPAGITGPQQYNNGYAFLTAYSPLVAASGPTNASWTLYGHFENVEFHMPVLPQSANSRIKTRVTRKKSAELKEQLANDIGPLETAFSQISATAGSISGVPLLSSIGSTVKWASDISGKVASAFGWSKPYDATPYCKMKRDIIPRFNNADTANSDAVLGVLEKNSIEQMPGFSGNNLDELSINYISSISAWYRTVVWSETGVSGILLYTDPVTPRNYVDANAYVGGNVWFTTPVAYCSNFFTQWRGSIKYTIKVVKTEFHSGRLLVCFNPYNYEAYDAGPPAVTIANSTYLHREIFDIRLGNEFTFVVPWLSLTPYKPLFGLDRVVGELNIFILNPLVAPATVSSSVTLLVEVSGGEDLEFAVPRSITESVVTGVTPQSGDNICETFSSFLGNANSGESLAPSRFCVGERILSLRQLIKRFNQMQVNASGPVQTYMDIFPWSLYARQITSLGFLNGEFTYSDVFSHVASCFALSRGSMRFKVIEEIPSDNITMTARVVPVSRLTGPSNRFNYLYTTTAPIVADYGNGDNNTVSYSSISGGIEYTVPYYNRLFAHATADTMNNTSALSTTLYDFRSTVPREMVVLYWRVPPSQDLQFLRAVGEDFELGLFVSTPPLDSWSTDI